MNPTDISALPLRDIHLPGAVGWWPPAFGWWLVAAVLLAAASAYAVLYYRDRHRRAALRALKRVRAALEQGAEPVASLQRVSTLLRRFAMTTAQAAAEREPLVTIGGDEVGGLIGERWLQYLDSRWQRDAFTRGAGRLLLAAPYARPDSVERLKALELTALCSEWLKAEHGSRPRLGPRRRAAAGRPVAHAAGGRS
jgi:hypothetical protein